MSYYFALNPRKYYYRIKQSTETGLIFKIMNPARWQNLKNLSGGLNLSRGLNMVGSISNVSRFKPALNLNRVLADFAEFKPRLKFFKLGLR